MLFILLLLSSTFIIPMLLMTSGLKVIDHKLLRIMYFEWAALLVLLFLFLVKERRHFRRSKLIPECSGIVCPACVRKMEVNEKGTQARCTRCKAVWPVEVLQEFWGHQAMPNLRMGFGGGFRNMRSNHPGSYVWYLKTLQKYDTTWRRFPRGLWLKARKKPYISGFVISVLGALVLPSLFLLFGVLSPVQVIPLAIVIFLALLVTIMTSTASAAGKLDEDKRVCAKCGYIQDPGGKVSDRCPECGSDWSRIGGTVRGVYDTSVTHPPFMKKVRFGISSLIVFFLFSMGMSPVFYSRFLPSSMLIYSIEHSGSSYYRDEYIKALFRRGITTEQRDWFCKYALDERLRNGDSYNYYSLGQVLDSWFINDTLPPQFRKRYIDEIVDMYLTAPDTAYPGENLHFGLHCQNRNRYSLSNVRVYVMVGGLFVNGELLPGTDSLPATEIKNTRDNYAKFSLVSGPAGSMSLRCDVWLIITSGRVQGKNISRDDSGKPVLPGPASLLWMGEKSVEKTITVSPTNPTAPTTPTESTTPANPAAPATSANTVIPGG